MNTEIGIILGIVGTIAFAILSYLFGLFRMTFITLSAAVVGSLTIHFPYIFVAKNLRVTMTVVILAVALWEWTRRKPALDPLIVAILAFLGFYMLSATWSETATTAILYKGLFVLMAGAGVLAGWAQNDTEIILRNIRTMFLTFAALSGLVWVMVVMEGGLGSIVGRLDPYGLNANGIGERAMLLVVLGVAMLQFEKAGWKSLAWAGIVLGSITMLLSGSRAAIGGCGVMLAIVFGYQIKNFIVPALLIGGSIAALLLLMPELAEKEAVTRLEDTDVLGRWTFWIDGLEGFRENPLFGIGWVSAIINFRLSSLNVHSIYITVLSEAGLVGFLFMMVMIGLVIWRSVRSYFGLGTNPTVNPIAYRLMGALAAFYIMKGLFESGLMYGTSTSVLVGYLAFASFGCPALVVRRAGTEVMVPGVRPVGA